MTRKIELIPSDYQRRVLEIPPGTDIVQAGSRAGGKSWVNQFLACRYAKEYPGMQALVVRSTKASTASYFLEQKTMAELWFGRDAVNANSQRGTIQITSGGATSIITFGMLSIQQDLDAVQGFNAQLLVIEEGGQLRDWNLYSQLLAVLRSGSNIPCQVSIAANPLGAGHQQFYKRFLKNRDPWVPHTDISERSYVICPSLPESNPHLNAGYLNQFNALKESSPDLYEAWRHGNWNVGLTDGFFENSFDPIAGVLPSFRAGLPMHLRRSAFTSTDWGSHSPCFTMFMANTGPVPLALPSLSNPDETVIVAPYSWIVFDDMTSASEEDFDRGDNTSAAAWARAVVARCKHWGITSAGTLDSSAFVSQSSEQATIAGLMKREGLRVKPCLKKRRVGRLQQMRVLMSQCGSPTKPGLYFTSDADATLALIPLARRAKNNPEDLAQYADHWADACAYGLAYRQGGTRIFQG